MQLLLLTSIVDGIATNACGFEVAVDGGAFQSASTLIPGPLQFSVDDSASFVDIRATPLDRRRRPW